MKVKLIDITERPIEKIYKCYRQCYSKYTYDEIQLPKLELCKEPSLATCLATDKSIMKDFIKDKIDLGHLSPLEHVTVSFSIEGLSRSALAQLTRHRTFKFSVQSQRYIDAKNFDFVVPELDYIKDKTTKFVIQEHYKNLFKTNMKQYEDLIKMGVKKEDARAILPQATTCNLIVTCDLRNFRNFLEQRLCTHAQQEIRELANKMNELVKKYVSFVDYKVMRCQQGLCNQCSK